MDHVLGGYDERVSENVEHLQELKACVESLGLEACVEFRRNIGDGKHLRSRCRRFTR